MDDQTRDLGNDSFRNAPPVPMPSGDRYRDLGLIGRGGMGEVRRVRDELLGRVVALKVVRADLASDPRIVERFRREARVGAWLEHPGIVPVYDHGSSPDGTLWMTMREVRGQGLDRVAADVHAASDARGWGTAGRWTFRRMIDAFGRCCAAVAYAHAQGVIHRDLKPQNVLVGPFGEVQVVDWGLARVLSDPSDDRAAGNADEPGLTAHGGALGSPSTMAPEQARGDLRAVGPRSDVYSLGATLFHLLTGRPAFMGSAEQLARRLDRGALPAPIDILGPDRPPVPDPLNSLCRRAMALDPSSRFSDAGELAAELEAWLDDARRRQRALALVEAARRLAERAVETRERAAVEHRAANRLLDDVLPHEPISHKREGWEREDAAKLLDRKARLEELELEQTLRAALNLAPELPEAHEALAEHYAAKLIEAEESRSDRAEDYLYLLRTHDRGRFGHVIAGTSGLSLHTDPPGARIVARPFSERARRLVPGAAEELGSTPLIAAEIRHGSWLLEITTPDHEPVRLPVFLARGEHWAAVPPGETTPSVLRLPRIGEISAEEVLVPAGWFLSGGDPLAIDGLPRRRLWLDGFVARRTVVRHVDYLAFLNDLLAQGRQSEAERWVARAPTDLATPLHRLVAGRFQIPDEVIRFAVSPRHPITLVTHDAARAYCAWRASRDALPWRLPHDQEWEKGARGVDGRAFPWGDHYDPTRAVLVDSQPGSPRLREVGSVPADVSPYGLLDCAGNVREWCANSYTRRGPAGPLGDSTDDDGPTRIVRGGSAFSGQAAARAASRFGNRADQRSPIFGFRMVRTWA